LTPQTPDVEGATPNQADLVGAPDTEVTPAMIDAGLAELYESGAIEHPVESADKMLVARIFATMKASAS
jgi:hypothetical protein